MKLIVGLGNPGKRYINTRHNVGFQLLDSLLSQFSVSPHISRKLKAIYYTVHIPPRGELKAVLAKPLTFMNDSGGAVKKLLEYFSLDVNDVTVIHDDVDLELGEYKIQKGRGSAGHRGVESVIEKLGSHDFTRIRIGVDRPPYYINAQTYVMQNFTKDQKEILDSVFLVLKRKITNIILTKSKDSP